MKSKEQYTTFSCILGNLVKKYRNIEGMSQPELAQKIGVNRITQSKIENGESELSAPILAQLDELFDKNLMSEANIEKKLLEKYGVQVFFSNKSIPKDSDIKNDSNTGKYIVGAVAIATLVSFLTRK